MTKNTFDISWSCDGKVITTPVGFSKAVMNNVNQYRTYFYDKENNIHVYVLWELDGEFYSTDYGTVNGANQRKFERAVREYLNPSYEYKIKVFNIKTPQGKANVEYFPDGFFSVHVLDKVIHFNIDHEQILFDHTGLTRKVKKLVEQYIKQNP